jgi:hypothetical protein
VDPVPDPLVLRKSGSDGNRTRTSGSVARNSDHWTTEAVFFLLTNYQVPGGPQSKELVHFVQFASLEIESLEPTAPVDFRSHTNSLKSDWSFNKNSYLGEDR